MSSFVPFRSTIAVLPIDNVDTDQIMPARFLKVTTKEGLGASLFYDWRFDREGRERPEFALNAPAARGARVLVAGDNFGCGSSREHAPWGLVDYGFKAVVSTSFADIFHQNALKNGLLPIKIEADAHLSLLQAGSGAEVTIDLERQALTLPNGRSTSFPIDLFAKRCLLLGVDELGYLLGFADAVAAYEAAQPGRFDTRSLAI